MFNHLKKIVVLLIVVLFTGCANVTPMAINKSTKEINTSEKSIVLFSVNIRRHESSRYIPKPNLIQYDIKNAEGKSEIINFSIDKEAGIAESDISNIFYMRTALAPGEYTLHNIFGIAHAFPFVGHFQMPVVTKVTVPKDSVVYVGRIDALLRPRTDTEFRAGPLIPLIDQAATGISNRTFELVFKDNSEEDFTVFKQRFPVLEDVEIKTMILAPWSRDAADAAWAGNEPQ